MNSVFSFPDWEGRRLATAGRHSQTGKEKCLRRFVRLPYTLSDRTSGSFANQRYKQPLCQLPVVHRGPPTVLDRALSQLALYQILFYFETFVLESIIRLLPPPTCVVRIIAIALHVYCAAYSPPPTPLLVGIHLTIRGRRQHECLGPRGTSCAQFGMSSR